MNNILKLLLTEIVAKMRADAADYRADECGVVALDIEEYADQIEAALAQHAQPEKLADFFGVSEHDPATCRECAQPEMPTRVRIAQAVQRATAGQPMRYERSLIVADAVLALFNRQQKEPGA